ncbi:MAG: hypothetical protein JW959_02885 [Pirellulales bacterium]|nr:hypothetical protein [Pirellulales bacterium]
MLKLIISFFVFFVFAVLFIVFPWPVALLVASGINAVMCVGFGMVGQFKIAGFCGAATVLILMALFFTDWGLSSIHPVVHIAWPYLIAAIVAEVTAVVCWLKILLPSSLSSLP